MSSLCLCALIVCHSSLFSAPVDGDPAEHTQSLDWSQVRDGYARFDPSDVQEGGSGMADWLHLKIHTRHPASGSQPKKEAHTCSVCLDTEREMNGWTSTPCSHRFHAKCLDGWKAFQKMQGRGASCPMCRGALD